MKAVHKFLIGAASAAVAAGGLAAPAAAQYYPNGYGTGNVLVGAILDSILRGGAGGGYGSYGQYGYGGNYGYSNERVAVDQCARATEARLNGAYRGYNNGYYQNYGYNSAVRVNQIERVERTRNGNFRVVGWAGDAGWRGNYGAYGGYGGYGNTAAPQIRFSCKFDIRSGRISDLDLNRQRYARYGY